MKRVFLLSQKLTHIYHLQRSQHLVSGYFANRLVETSVLFDKCICANGITEIIVFTL